MTRGELAKIISDRTGVPASTVDTVLTSMIEVITLTIATGEEVSIRTFGRFVPRGKSAATKANPRTGAPMVIPARKTVVFFPSTKMKDRLNGRRARRQ